MKQLYTYILLILTMLFWAGNYIVGSHVVLELSPVWMTFIRWVFSFVLLLPIAIFIEKPRWYEIKAYTFQLILLGILGILSYNLLLYSALSYTSPTNAALINALNPGAIALLSIVILKERFTLLQWFGLFISLVGVGIIITGGKVDALLLSSLNKGDLLILSAVFIWALYSIIGKKINVPPITATAISTLFAMIILTPIAFSTHVSFHSLSAKSIYGMIFIVIFPSTCAFIFWNVAVRQIEASKAGIFINLIPVFTAIISFFLGDTLKSTQLIGGFFVIGGVLFTSGILFGKSKPNRGKQVDHKNVQSL